MASHGQPSANIAYDPLPLTTEDHGSNALYNAPPSPDPRLTSFHDNNMQPGLLPDETSAIPTGAAQPRFMAAPLYDQGGSITRDSFASNSIHGGQQSEYGSVYALNDTRGGPYRDDPNGDGFRDSMPMSPVGHSRALNEKNDVYAAPKQKSRKTMLIVAAVVALLLIAAAVIVPVYFTVIKPKNNAADSSSPSSDGKDHTGTAKPTATKTPENVVTGGDGSTITMENGETFTYRNKFGGYWYYDPNDPYSGSGKAQSWTPAINETFNYGIDKIRGVNVGGWLNPEPFIAPALYQKYLPRAVDEWTLTTLMAADTAGGGLKQMEDHYQTFITEKDFAEIAGAGLNYVRVPIGYWAVEKRSNEPYLEGVSWEYFLKAIKWARKYGLRINLDLHAVPGSQNGWNHSGRLGGIGFLMGPMGYANAQRTLNVIRVLAEFISQPQYKDVVSMFGILNEPSGSPNIGQQQLASFYFEAYNIVRQAGGGSGADKGVWISLHDGFLSRQSWFNLFPNADRVSLDSHPYLAFGGQSDAPMSSYANTPCTAWGASINETMAGFGLFNAGEFSNAVTDCGLFLNEVGEGTRYEGTYTKAPTTRVGSCTPWTDWQNYTPQMKAEIKQFALASMDALQNYFFWTWKIGNSSETGVVETPAWSYQLGLENGWMPENPREADGTCGNTDPWTPPLQPWQLGGAGAGNIPASVTAQYGWPPASISRGAAVADMLAYTPTGTILTLTASTVTAASGEHVTQTADPGNGWNNAADNAPMYVEVSGCTYLDPWVDPGTANPGACAGAAAINRRAPAPAPIPNPLITPPPTA